MSFKADKETGANGEAFMQMYQRYLIDSDTVFWRQSSGNVNRLHSEAWDNETDAILHDNSGRVFNEQYNFGGQDLIGISCTERGNSIAISTDRMECKLLQNFGCRNNDPLKAPSRSGTLPFEIFNEHMHSFGWLFAFAHTEQYNSENKYLLKKWLETRERKFNVLYERPTMLAYLLGKGPTRTPYAAIVFEDVNKLLERLEELCPWMEDSEQWLDRWDTSKSFEEDGGGIIRIKNMLHVPLECLSDLCTVTLIDTMPTVNSILNKDHWSTLDSNHHLWRMSEYDLHRLANIAQGRLDYLKSLSERRGDKWHMDTATAIPQAPIIQIRQESGED